MESPSGVEVTVSTPVRAQFDDSDFRKEPELDICESFNVDDEKASSGPPRDSKSQRLRSFLHHTSK